LMNLITKKRRRVSLHNEFGSISHGIEEALVKLKEQYNEKRD